MVLLALPKTIAEDDEDLHILHRDGRSHWHLPPFIANWLSSSLPPARHHRSILVSDGSERIAVVRDDSIYICSHDYSSWLEPPLRCDVVSGINCLSWMPYSDSLLVATQHGIFSWKLWGIEESNTEDCVVFPLNPEPGFSPAWMLKSSDEFMYSVVCSPQGCTFATISSSSYGVGILTAVHFDVKIWDTCSVEGTPLSLPREDFSRATSRSCVAPVLQWSPCAEFLAVGTDNGSIYVIDTDTWEHNKCCQLGSAITDLVWVSDCECALVRAHSLEVHILHVTRKKQNHSPSGDSQGVSTVVSVSAVPVSLSGLMPSVLNAGAITSDDSGVGYEEENKCSVLAIDRICADPSSQLLAVSFAKSDRRSQKGFPSSSEVFPCVALCTYRSAPFLSLSLVRVIQSPSQEPVPIIPKEFVFRPRGRGKDLRSDGRPSLNVLWSSEAVTLEHFSIDY